MAITITRTSGDEHKATLAITDAKGRTITGTWYADGSGDVTDGPRWLLDQLRKEHGKRHISSAIQQAVTTGAASL